MNITKKNLTFKISSSLYYYIFKHLQRQQPKISSEHLKLDPLIIMMDGNLNNIEFSQDEIDLMRCALENDEISPFTNEDFVIMDDIIGRIVTAAPVEIVPLSLKQEEVAPKKKRKSLKAFGESDMDKLSCGTKYIFSTTDKSSLKVFRKYVKMARSNPSKYLTEDGCLEILDSDSDQVYSMPLNGRKAKRGSGAALKRGFDCVHLLRQLGYEKEMTVAILKTFGFGAITAHKIIKKSS